MKAVQTTTRSWQLGVSLVLALVMWLNFSGRLDQDQPEAIRVYPQIPISQENLPPNFKLRADTYQVSVTVSGLEREIRKLNPNSDLKLNLDFSGFQSGTYNIALLPKNVRLPPELSSLKITNLTPDIVRVTLTEYATKKIPIFQPTEGTPARSYEIKEVTVTPNEVTVNGPAAQISALKSLIANPVRVENATRSLEGALQLDFNHQVPHDVAIQELGSLRYKIQIEEKHLLVYFNTNYSVTSPDKDYKFKPQKAKLSIRVPLSLEKWFQPTWVSPEVLVTELILEEDKGHKPQADRAKTPISTKWHVPDEFLKIPDWKSRIERIELRWDPPEVEVTKK